MKGQAEKWFQREIDIGIERMCSAGMRFRVYSEDDQTALLITWVEILWGGMRWDEEQDKERISKVFGWLIANLREFPTVPDFREGLIQFPRLGIEHVKPQVDREVVAENWRRIRGFLSSGDVPTLIRVDENEQQNTGGR